MTSIGSNASPDHIGMLPLHRPSRYSSLSDDHRIIGAAWRTPMTHEYEDFFPPV
jgi:hypothetical protein